MIFVIIREAPRDHPHGDARGPPTEQTEQTVGEKENNKIKEQNKKITMKCRQR